MMFASDAAECRGLNIGQVRPLLRLEHPLHRISNCDLLDFQ